MRKALMFAALALAALPGFARAADCKGKDARYAMAEADAKDFSLTLTLRPEPMAWSDLDVVLKTPTRTFRFSLTASNGYSYNYAVQEEPVISTEESDSGENGSQRIYFFNKDLDLLEMPQGANAAPDMIFMPDFGGALWYDGNDPREYLPIGMWRLQGCN